VRRESEWRLRAATWTRAAAGASGLPRAAAWGRAAAGAPGSPRAVPAAPDLPPPSDLVVALCPGVRILAGGRVLVGGTPVRVLRLMDAGAAAVRGWRSGGPVGPSPGRRALARRLLDAGLLSPRPAPVAPGGSLAIVVPVRDRPGELARCLGTLCASCPGSPLVVVDDGSADAAAIRAVCADRGAASIRHDAPRGPAAARNRGLAACDAPFVAFVDSDVVASGADERHLVRQHGHTLGRRQGFDLLGHRADHRRGDGGAIVAACSGVAHHPGRTAVQRDLLALLLQHLAAAVAGRRLQADGNLPERRGSAGRRGITEVAVL